MIELYIENKKIDITDDLEINFTYESIDPDKLSAIKNSFSKTVNIPGTPSNNITFGHIFRYDKYIPVSGPVNIENYYDPHKKVNWFINKNGSVINRGYCTLDNIIVKNERDITYQLTLYGGIGEFFYSLSYNEDGSPKTLYDMFWNWYPKVGLIGHGAAMNESEENVKTIYNCSASIVASSYHRLNPLYRSTGTTDIDKDVVFVPCYTGLYEDFDSKHMLVSTFNQNYNSLPSYISNETKYKLLNSFPDTYIEDGETYTTLGSTLSSTDTYKYGLVTFPRDLDPWEAGDIRINELPVAVRLSKMMEVISNSKNNGGYEVIWDSEIKNSYQWLYGWVMLGKIKQDLKEIEILGFNPSSTLDGQVSEISVNYNTGVSSLDIETEDYYIPTNTNTVEKGTYNLSINVIPNFTINIDIDRFVLMSDNFSLIYGCSKDYNNGFDYIWNTSVLVHKIYSDNDLIKTIADIFYYTSDTSKFYFGYNTNNTTDRNIKASLENKLNEIYGINIDQFTYHNCKLSDYNKDEVNSLINYSCSNEKISTELNITSNISDFKVEQSQTSMWTRMNYTENTGFNITSGMYGTDSLTYDTDPYTTYFYILLSKQGLIGFFKQEDNTASIRDELNEKYSVSTSFNINESGQNGLLLNKNTGFNIIQLTKESLFSNSKSPLSYLSGYCKLMNYKFICNETEKIIYIKTLKNYYKDNIINLDSRVDIGRDINIKNITTKYKLINIGLNTPETYPVYIFNKISRDKFNIQKQDTGIKYNATETKLLNDLVYDNLIDWQQSSIYYNNYPQFPRAYDTQSISWTLFNKDQVNLDDIKKKEIYTTGIESNSLTLSNSIDFLPKISLFDKDNKEVDFESSLIFLNGFVKNYDYSLVGERTGTLSPDLTIENKYINNSGNQANSSTQDIYVYNITEEERQNKVYKVTFDFGADSQYYAIVYFDNNGNRTGYEYQKSSTPVIDEILTIPTGTTKIYFTHKKTDTTAKLTSTYNYYSISPKVSFSNDMYEMYYLNQERCYIYDFKYDNNFTSWGSYSNNQKGTATSWVLPLFSKDLYNLFIYGRDEWWGAEYKLSSWNIIDQKGLDDLYKLKNTTFIIDPSFEFSKTTYNNNSIQDNEYSFENFPKDEESYTERIYNKYWKDYLNDLYDRNTRDIVAYVDLSGLGDASSIMRNIYSYKSHLWIITKLENFKISETVHNKFTKVTLHKIKNKDTWTN